MTSAIAIRLLAAAMCAAAPLAPASAQNTEPPHAWLFGTWTGGLFPAPSTVTASSCLGQPVVVFTRDVVLRATLTDVTYIQRIVATARTDPGKTDFQFTPIAAPSGGLFAETLASSGPHGFGCESPDVLHVQRRGENEISFPGCADFPNPLIRCPSR